MEEKNWYELFMSNMGKIIGAVAGLFIGFLFLRYGFFKGLFLLVFILIGVYIGSHLEKSQNWNDFLSRLWPPKINK